MKLAMTIDEALEFADEWSRGLTLYEGAQGWRVVCMLLAEEVRAKREELAHVGAADEAMEKDAERYRFLCECDTGNLHYWLYETQGEIGRDLTAGIDAAMQTHNAVGQQEAACGASAAPTGCASNGNYNERTDK